MELQIENFRAKANELRGLSWCPYSKFPVIAVVETLDGQLYSGTNVENANFSLTVHAEQSAILAAIHDGAIKRLGLKFIKTVYVHSASHSAPCGGCRQFINEFAAVECIWIGENSVNNEVQSLEFAALLPISFGPDNLSI